MNMVNITRNSTEDMINKLQELKAKTKIKFYEIISNYYDKMNIRWMKILLLEVLKVLVKFIMKYSY